MSIMYATGGAFVDISLARQTNCKFIHFSQRQRRQQQQQQQHDLSERRTPSEEANAREAQKELRDLTN